MPGEGLEYVKLGHQVGTYYYPTHGEKIIRLALDILTGKPFERENPLLGIRCHTRECGSCNDGINGVDEPERPYGDHSRQTGSLFGFV